MHHDQRACSHQGRHAAIMLLPALQKESRPYHDAAHGLFPQPIMIQVGGSAGPENRPIAPSLRENACAVTQIGPRSESRQRKEPARASAAAPGPVHDRDSSVVRAVAAGYCGPAGRPRSRTAWTAADRSRPPGLQWKGTLGLGSPGRTPPEPSQQ